MLEIIEFVGNCGKYWELLLGIIKLCQELWEAQGNILGIIDMVIMISNW